MTSKMKIVLCSIGIAFSSMCTAQGSTQGQVTLVGPVGVQIASGGSSWSAHLPQPVSVNPIRISFWNNGKCPIIPITSLAVKYINDPYWYNANPKNGYYYVDSRFLIDGVRADFYLDGAPESCVIQIAGFRNIAPPYGMD